MARFLLSFAVCVSLVTSTFAAPRLSVLHRSYAFRLLGLKAPSQSSRRTSSSRTTVTTGNTIKGPGTVNDRFRGSTSGAGNPEVVGITGFNNQGDVGMFGTGADLNMIGSTNPADLNMIGSTNPADLNMMGSTNPADLNMMGSTNPADLNMMGSTNPADLNMMGLNDPADLNMMGSTNPADLNMMGSTNPADLNMMGLNDPAGLNMMGSGPAFTDGSHGASVGGPYSGYQEITSGKYSNLGSGTGPSTQSQGYMEMILPDNFQVGSGGILTEASLGPTSQQPMVKGGKSGPQVSIKTGKYSEITSGKYSNLGSGTGPSTQSQGHMEMILPDNLKVGSGGILTEGSFGSTSQQRNTRGGKSGPQGSTKTGIYSGTGPSTQSQGNMEMILPDNFQVGYGGIITEGSFGSTSQQRMMKGGKSGPQGSTKTGTYPEITPGKYSNFGSGIESSTQSQGNMEMILPDNFQVGSGGILTEGSLGSTSQQRMMKRGKSGPQGSTKTGKYPEITSGKYSNHGSGIESSTQSQGHMEMILPDNFQVGSGGILTEASLGPTSQQRMMKGGKSGHQGLTKTGKYPEITSGKYSNLGSGTGPSTQSQGHMEMILPDNFQVGSGGILTEGSFGSSSVQSTMKGSKSGPQGSTKTGIFPESTSGKYSNLGSGTGPSTRSQGHMEMILPDNFQVGSGGILTEGSFGSTSQQRMMKRGKSGPQGSTKTGKYPEITPGKYSNHGSGIESSTKSQGHMEMILPDNFQVGSGGILTEASLGPTSQQRMMKGGKYGPQGLTKTGKYPEITSGKYSNLGSGTGSSTQSQGHMEMILPDNFQVGSGGFLTEASLGPTSQQRMMKGGKSGHQGLTKTGKYSEITPGKYSNLGSGTGSSIQSQGHMEMILPDNFQVGSGGILTEGSLGYSSQQDMMKRGKFGHHGSTKTGKYTERVRLQPGPHQDAGKGMVFIGSSSGSQKTGTRSRSQLGAGNGMIYVGTASGSQTTEPQFRPGMVLQPSSALPQGGVVTFVEGGDVTVRSQGQVQTYEAADLMP